MKASGPHLLRLKIPPPVDHLEYPNTSSPYMRLVHGLDWTPPERRNIQLLPQRHAYVAYEGFLAIFDVDHTRSPHSQCFSSVKSSTSHSEPSRRVFIPDASLTPGWSLERLVTHQSLETPGQHGATLAYIRGRSCMFSQFSIPQLHHTHFQLTLMLTRLPSFTSTIH